MGNFRPNSRDNMPFFIGGAAILLIMVLYFAVTPGSDQDQAVKELEDRLIHLGQRITVLERQNAELRDYLDEMNMKTGDFSSQYNRLMAIPEEVERAGERIKHLETRQGNLEKRMGSYVRSGGRSGGRSGSGSSAGAAAASPARKTISPATRKPDAADRAKVVKPGSSSTSASARASSGPATATPAPAAAPAAPRPAPSPVATPSASPGTRHIVKDGDTLYSIARAYGLTVSELRSLNGLSEEAVIHPGQALIVGR